MTRTTVGRLVRTIYVLLFRWKLSCAAHALLLLACAAPLARADIFVATNSVWRFFRGTNEASAPLGTEWRTNTFDDSAWEVGPAPFYYGTNYSPASGTLLSDMQSNYTCIFLRSTFVLSNAAQINGLTNRPFADDGFIIWINGLEIRRFNVPGSVGTFQAYTNNASSTNSSPTAFQDNAKTNVLRTGTNVLALQIFNVGVRLDGVPTAINDGDFFANPQLSLSLADLTAPSVQSVTPVPGSTLTNFSQLLITFSESVTNVRAADLRINGQPAVTLSGTNATYTFGFPSPSSGTVQVTWDSAQAIKDRSGNRFDGTNIVWTFSNFIEPVRIVSASPAPGSTLSSFTQVTITFNAAMTGIEAQDLLINGNAANTLSGSGATWTFSFSQPPPGPVQIGWDGAHAIYDAAGNRFDETALVATWNYVLLDVIVPAVLTTTPAPGAVVGSLSQVEVTFREAVTGVNAADLLINGQPAAGVIGTGPGPYLFSFAQPVPQGGITVSWASGHGIADSSGNPFGGPAAAGWTYSLVAGLVTDVVINEIMAENLNGILDANGDTSDWIELFNRGSSSVNLLGWSLTDDATRPGHWVFPAVTLGAGQYLLVFASGKDRVTTNGTNHTSFALANSEYLGLFNAESPRRVIDEFAPVFPEQRGDISWGRSGSNLVYFATATPRAPNSTGTNYSGFVEVPHASVNSGLFGQPFTLALSCATPGAAIYYTTNNDVPSQTNGVLYTSPFVIAGSSNKAVIPIRAAAFKSGLLPSTVLTRSYIFPDLVIYQPFLPAGFPATWVSSYPGATASTAGDYQMDPQVLTNGSNAQIARAALRQLPTVSLVTSIATAFAPTNGVYSGRRKVGNQRPVNAEMWLPNGEQVFHVDCGFEIQGGSSPTDASGDWKDKKLSLRLIFKGDFGTPKLNAKVFDDTPVDEFDTLILDAGLNWWWTHMTDATQRDRAKFITDTITSDLMNNAGLVAQHTRYVHLYLDGLYWGLYFLHERMDEAAAATYLGGQKEEWDVLKHTGDSSGLQNGTMTDYNAMLTRARAGVANNAVYEQLQASLDVPWLVDYMIVNFWVGNDDWPHHNWYAWRRTRSPGSLPWRFISWDAEHTFKGYSYGVLGNGNLNSANSPGELFRLLTNNLEFRVTFGDHVQKLMFNDGALYSLPNKAAFWSPTNPSVNVPAAVYRKRVDEIWDSIVCESARWGDVATANANNPYTRELHYLRELNALYNITNVGGVVNYFPLRGSNVLAQFRTGGLYPNVAAPAFNQHGGRIAASFNLIITNVAGAGTLYYTTNGSDPRVYGLGGVSPQATVYTGTPVSLGRTTVVKARTRSNTTWSALNEATFTVNSLGVPLRLTEIMYSPIGGDDYEFVELQNAGAVPIDLGSFSFAGISFTFPLNFVLGSGQRIVLGNNANTNAFKARYPGVSVAGWFGGSLQNGGETITVFDGVGRTVLSVSYDDEDGWATAPDGGGQSLEFIDLNGDSDDPANWRASSAPNGTPGQINSALPAATVVLNEVMAENLTAVNHEGTYPDWVELFNSSAADVNLTGWSLTDDGNIRKYVFPVGTTVASGGYLVVWCDTNTATSGFHSGFALGRNGESVFLYDANGNRADAISFGPQVADYSIGRVGGAWALTTPTVNAANVAAALAPATALSINEWLANAVPGADDWLEVFNTSGTAPAALRNIYLGTSNALFQLRSLSFVPPRGFVQLIADENAGPDHLDFKLPASPGAIILYDAAGAELQRVNYGAQVQGVSQGRLPDGSANIVAFPGSASPGGTNYLLNYTGPVLNELLARNSRAVAGPWGSYPDYVEIYNPGAAPFNLGGMGLSDDADEVKFTFAPGTVIGANGFLIVWCDGDRGAITNGNLNSGFSLSGSSGGAYLFNAIGQVVNSVEYGFQVPDLPIGLSGGQWSLLSAITPGAANAAPAPLGSTSNLRINEWMANLTGGDDWFELYNLDPLPADMTGLFLTDDPSLAGVSNTPIAALSFIGGNNWVKWVADGNPSNGRDHVAFALDESGDTIRIYAPDASLIDSIAFGAQLDGVSQGRLPDGGTNIVSFPTTPTPEASNYLPLPDVVINEVLTHTDPPLEDAIEIQNIGTNQVTIGDWFISNSQTPLKKFRIASGTTLGSGAFKVFYENQFNADGSGNSTNFTLNSARGDAVYVSEADSNGNLSGYRAQVSFGAAENAVSFGRFPTSVGVDFTAIAQRTFGADNPATPAQFRTGTGLSNSYPKIGPIIFNEIMYHPVSGSGSNATENANEEFIELRNVTGSAVPLFDPAHPDNRWRLSGGVSFTFSSNTTVAANGYLLVVGFDPAANAIALLNFRGKYGTNGVMVGPFQGRLDNAGEALELYKPDAPQQPPHPDAGFVPMILVDRVVYDELAPWPAAADGGGAALRRVSLSGYGNDPTNWVAAVPDFGGGADSDGDGIPDSWENQYPAILNANNPADASLDPDGDGLSNLQEYRAGTNPTSASSTLRIISVENVGGNNLRLTFFAVSNKTYTVEFKNALADPSWSQFTNIGAASFDRLMPIQTTMMTNRFYRVRTP